MGTYERAGVCRLMWDQELNYLAFDGDRSLLICELVERAAGHEDRHADAGVMSAFAWAGGDEDDGYWQEKVDEYRAQTGRRYPPVYRATIRVEAEVLGDDETAAYWKARKGAGR